ncbi:MAG TPA: hypothetical protein VGB76_01885 [Pyrinomonadaceae bacterium]|jgi:hypothetical protein
MQTEFDKEIDALLREGARRGRAASAERAQRTGEREENGGARAASSGAHLDADELNAYAENSLPPAARTYYAAHLADCDDCRRSVTQLALAAGMPSQLEQRAAAATTQEVSKGVTWRERLGALFAPRAWRYAVPALALLLVGAVALLVLTRDTRQQREVSIAQQQQPQPRNASEQAKPTMPETHHAAQNTNAAAGEGDPLSAANSNAPGAKEELAAVSKEEQAQPGAGVILSDSTVASPPPPAPLSPGASTAAAPVTTTAAPSIPVPQATPAPVPEAVITTQEAEQKLKVGGRTDELARDAQRQGNYENSSPRDRISGPRRNNDQRNMQRGVIIDGRDSSDKNEGASAAPAPVPPAGATAARRAKPREADGERGGRTSDDSVRSAELRASKSVAETRTVAGRKFRRTGGAWVDTAYNSAQAVTVVRRNSEQYRALVADEPQLRRISDALGGEVTIVWKGRAYRIR